LSATYRNPQDNLLDDHVVTRRNAKSGRSRIEFSNAFLLLSSVEGVPLDRNPDVTATFMEEDAIAFAYRFDALLGDERLTVDLRGMSAFGSETGRGRGTFA